MTEDTTPADPHAGDTGNPQPDAATTTTTDPHAGEGQNETLSLEEARKIRSESTNLRKRLKDSETLLAELKAFKEQKDAESLSEQEKQALAQQKQAKQLADLQSAHDRQIAENQDLRVSSAIQLHALQNGIDPKLAQRLLDRTQLEHDENGNPTNLDTVFKSMVKEFNLTTGKPQPPTSGGATNPGRSTTGGPVTLTKEYVGQVVAGGKQAWEQLSGDEQKRISIAIRGGILNKR